MVFVDKDALVLAAAFAAALTLHAPAVAMEQSEDIDTNRPSFMDSPLVLPKGSAQFENGTEFNGFRGRKWVFDGPETEVRVGIGKRVELQAFTPNTNLLGSAHAFQSRVSDLTEVGVKVQLGPLLADRKSVPVWMRNYNLSVILAVSPPTGSPRVSTTGAGTGGIVRLPWSRSIGKNWSIGGMQSLLLINHGQDLQYQPDVLVGRNIGARASIFAEYGGFFTQGTAPQNMIHFGGVKKLTQHQQIDMHFGFGMNRAAPIAFVGIGYSFRLDHLPLISKL
jgi:Putative MetA-pathway of phenol degradation